MTPFPLPFGGVGGGWGEGPSVEATTDVEVAEGGIALCYVDGEVGLEMLEGNLTGTWFEAVAIVEVEVEVGKVRVGDDNRFQPERRKVQTPLVCQDLTPLGTSLPTRDGDSRELD